MAIFPHSLCGIRQDGHGEQHMPMVLRSDMERGIPKQRRAGADVLVRVPCSLVFRSAADAAAFESWFYAEGGGWFDFTLPRTGAVVQARIIGGDIGTLSPLTPAWNASERSVVLEYVRPAFVTLAPGLYDVDSSRILSVQRNTTATYIDDSGVLQTAPANTARYQGGQLLVEGEATNKVLNSRGDTIVYAAGTTPPVVTTGVAHLGLPCSSGSFAAGSNTGFNGSRMISFGVTMTAGVEAVGSSWLSLSRPLTGSEVIGYYWFGCPAVLITAANSAGFVGQWRRVETSDDVTGSGINTAMVYPAVSPLSEVTVYWCRHQWEEGRTEATSYIPTTTAAVTRAADIITVAA